MNDSTIQDIISLADKDPDIIAIWLYGSRATASFSPESDYDLAVLFASHITDPLDNRLRPELLAMDWQRALHKNAVEISVIDIKQVMIPLAFNAISGKLLLSKDHGFRMSAEAVISSKAELDYHHFNASYSDNNYLTS